MGFDNVNYTKFVRPQITTIAQPIRQMGEIALETLVHILEDKKPKEFHNVLDVTLIERDSTR